MIRTSFTYDRMECKSSGISIDAVWYHVFTAGWSVVERHSRCRRPGGSMSEGPAYMPSSVSQLYQVPSATGASGVT